MEPIVLSSSEFRDKVYACWMGKNIGGTLGAPWEGHRYVNSLDFYTPVPAKAAPNDDLDLQLVWLVMLEEEGVDPALPCFSEYWIRYADAYPWDEYGMFVRNYARGLRPPVAGCFENGYVDAMGSPIRSEIWAVLHPGDPQSAARMAWKDSAVDHAGGEGMHGEMFWAALQAAAFVESDPLTLIQIGLNMIPLSSLVARAIREALWCHKEGITWGQARERIHNWFQHVHACQAAINHGFTILGWLYGKDFGDQLCKAVNCGYDTDCTGATLGATLGIIHGAKGIPAEWLKPVGEEIVLHKFTRLPQAPKTITELTDRSITVAKKVADAKAGVKFGPATKLPADTLSRQFRNELAVAARAQDIHSSVEICNGLEVAFCYNGEPVLRSGIEKRVTVRVDGKSQPVDLVAPSGWTVTRLGEAEFSLLSPSAVADSNTVTVKVGTGSVDFTILGPSAATGFPMGVNVPKCPKCWARIEACVCKK